MVTSAICWFFVDYTPTVIGSSIYPNLFSIAMFQYQRVDVLDHQHLELSCLTNKNGVRAKSTSKGLVFKIQRGGHFGVFTKLPRLLCWGITQQNDIPRYAQIRGNEHRMATLHPGPAGGVTSRSTTQCPGWRFAAGETLWPGMWGEDAVRTRSGSPLR